MDDDPFFTEGFSRLERLLQDKLTEIEDDVRESIDDMKATVESPGYAIFIRYFETKALIAMKELLFADALDSAAVMRLQDKGLRYYAWAQAPKELLDSARAKEVAEERDAEVYDD